VLLFVRHRRDLLVRASRDAPDKPPPSRPRRSW
jgi:hypothetical protein